MECELEAQQKTVRARGLILTITVLALSCSPALQQSSSRTDELREMERRTYELVNNYRQSRGLKPLIWNNIISERALKHSERMASNRLQFSHAGFDNRVKQIATRMNVRNSSENIAVNWGYDDPAQKFVEGWIQSPGHLENIVRDYDFTGIGIAKSTDGSYYATQIFILTR